MKRVYLIRHADTPPRPGKPSDGDAIGITPRGHLEARAKGALLRTLGVRQLVSSPLVRARETAEELAKNASLPLSFDDRAKEFTAADVGPPDFKVLRDKARQERDWVGERGESFNASVARLTDLLQSVPNETCIVTHELLLQNFFLALTHTLPARNPHLTLFVLENNGGAWQLTKTIAARTFLQKIFAKLFG